MTITMTRCIAACWSTKPNTSCVLWGPVCCVGTQRDSTIPLRHALLHSGILLELAHPTGNCIHGVDRIY